MTGIHGPAAFVTPVAYSTAGRARQATHSQSLPGNAARIASACLGNYAVSPLMTSVNGECLPVSFGMPTPRSASISDIPAPVYQKFLPNVLHCAVTAVKARLNQL